MIKKEKLQWGNYYNEQSIEDNERLMRIQGAYNSWDESNDYEWNNMYDSRDEVESYRKYLSSKVK